MHFHSRQIQTALTLSLLFVFSNPVQASFEHVLSKRVTVVDKGVVVGSDSEDDPPAVAAAQSEDREESISEPPEQSIDAYLVQLIEPGRTTLSQNLSNVPDWLVRALRLYPLSSTQEETTLQDPFSPITFQNYYLPEKEWRRGQKKHWKKQSLGWQETYRETIKKNDSRDPAPEVDPPNVEEPVISIMHRASAAWRALPPYFGEFQPKGQVWRPQPMPLDKRTLIYELGIDIQRMTALLLNVKTFNQTIVEINRLYQSYQQQLGTQKSTVEKVASYGSRTAWKEWKNAKFDRETVEKELAQVFPAQEAKQNPSEQVLQQIKRTATVVKLATRVKSGNDSQLRDKKKLEALLRSDANPWKTSGFQVQVQTRNLATQSKNRPHQFTEMNKALVQNFHETPPGLTYIVRPLNACEILRGSDGTLAYRPLKKGRIRVDSPQYDPITNSYQIRNLRRSPRLDEEYEILMTFLFTWEVKMQRVLEELRTKRQAKMTAKVTQKARFPHPKYPSQEVFGEIDATALTDGNEDGQDIESLQTQYRAVLGTLLDALQKSNSTWKELNGAFERLQGTPIEVAQAPANTPDRISLQGQNITDAAIQTPHKTYWSWSPQEERYQAKKKPSPVLFAGFKTVDLSHNQISGQLPNPHAYFPASPLQVRELILTHNQVKSLAFLKNLTLLERLDLTHNALQGEIKLPTTWETLRSLNLKKNKITSVSFENDYHSDCFSRLKFFSLAKNNLDPMLSFFASDAAWQIMMHKLESLDLSGMQLEIKPTNFPETCKIHMDVRERASG